MLVFLTLITAGMQHLVQRMNYKRDVARIEGIVTQARRAAWGPKLARVETRRKVCCDFCRRVGISPLTYT